MNNYLKILLLAFFCSTTYHATHAAADIHKISHRRKTRRVLSPQKKSQIHILKKCVTYICTHCVEYLNIQERFDAGIKQICKKHVVLVEQAHDKTFFAEVLVPELDTLIVRELERLKALERERIREIQQAPRSPSPEFEEAQEQWEVFFEQLEDERDCMVRHFFTKHKKQQEAIMLTEKTRSKMNHEKTTKEQIAQHKSRIKELNILIKPIKARIGTKNGSQPYVSSPLRFG